MNKIDPETKADFLALVIVTAIVVIGLLFWQAVFSGVKDDKCPYCDQPVSHMNEDGEDR